MTVSIGNGVDIGNLVTVEINPITGVIKNPRLGGVVKLLEKARQHFGVG